MVVAHTHWDREWYAHFETYRSRLTSMLDGLVDLLDDDRRFCHFHLDGQVAVVEDYLAVRPEARPRIEALVAEGRLSVGPWYVLMDEFCVSAETVIRNLQKGLEVSAALAPGAVGGQVGYLPDMFGHIAQMPQILRQAGLDDAVVWRGVPAAVTTRAFTWVSPDGSRVRAEYLPVGYANGAFLPKDSGALIRRIAAHEQEIAGFLGEDGDLLVMNGGDHQAAQDWVPELLRRANSEQDRYHFVQSSLAEFLAGQDHTNLPEWSGELRSGARAPILMGVLSNRVDVKQAAARVEAALEKRAEPLATLWLPPDLWPAAPLERAWREVIRNSAHDSVCACSADEVVRAVLSRYDAARALADEVTATALGIATVATRRSGTVVVNPLPFDRSGVVELDLPGTEVPLGGQQVTRFDAEVTERTGTGADLGRLLGGLAADGWLGGAGRGVAAHLDDGDGLTLTIEEDGSRPVDPATASVMAEAWARAGAGRDRPLTVRVRRSPWQRVAVTTGAVPGWGWSVWEPTVSAGPVVQVTGDDRHTRLANGLCEVVVDHRSGRFALDGVGGMNEVVEEGDEGDTYNFSAAARPPVDTPSEVTVETLEWGPVRAVTRTVRRYPCNPPLVVTSDLTLTAGEPTVRVTTSFDHHGGDHRIRVVFPIGGVATEVAAECAFATVWRSGAEGGPHEAALATFPSRRFVTAGRLTLTHEGLLEHELVGDGTAVAVTLLRATGVISRPAPPARPNVAGPPLPLRDAQMPGPQVFAYAVALDVTDPWQMADATWTPLVARRAEGGGPLADRGHRLSLRGARVSALQRRHGRIEVRVFNPDPAPTTVVIDGHGGDLLDLRDRVLGRWEHSFPLRPWAFVTARLDATSLD